MSRSLTTFLDTPRSSSCDSRAKRSYTSKSSKVDLKRKPVGMYDALDWMEVKNTSLIPSRHTFKKKKFSGNLLADIHFNKTE